MIGMPAVGVPASTDPITARIRVWEEIEFLGGRPRRFGDTSSFMGPGAVVKAGAEGASMLVAVATRASWGAMVAEALSEAALLTSRDMARGRFAAVAGALGGNMPMDISAFESTRFERPRRFSQGARPSSCMLGMILPFPSSAGLRKSVMRRFPRPRMPRPPRLPRPLPRPRPRAPRRGTSE
jgi:hypothetical protein